MVGIPACVLRASPPYDTALVIEALCELSLEVFVEIVGERIVAMDTVRWSDLAVRGV